MAAPQQRDVGMAAGRHLCGDCYGQAEKLVKLFDIGFEGERAVIKGEFCVGSMEKKISNAAKCALCWQFATALQHSNVIDSRDNAYIQPFPWAQRSGTSVSLMQTFYRAQLSFGFPGLNQRTRLAELDIVRRPLASTPSGDSQQPFQRRFLTPTVSVEGVARWMSKCDDEHKHAKDDSREFQSLKKGGFKLLDLETDRVVSPESACKYAALSYRWEKNPEKGTIWDITNCPKTIRDAAKLAKALGVNYLWVDRLCIGQTTQGIANATKQMHLIFAGAAFTIVACGDSACEGLPGFGKEQERRIREGISECLIGNTVLRLAQARPSLHELVEACEWSDRAWTYQERLLSYRCLFFTKEEVFFSCPKQQDYNYGAGTSPQITLNPLDGPVKVERELELYNGMDWIFNSLATYTQNELGPKPIRGSTAQNNHFCEWRESYVLEDDSMPTCYRSFRPNSPGNKVADQLLISQVTGEWTGFARYAKFVEEYTRRKMSDPNDAVAAFLGILSQFWHGHSVEGAAEHGFPREQFNLALLWSSTRSGQRRKCKRQFPTWSWAGWDMPARYIPPTLLAKAAFYRSLNREKITNRFDAVQFSFSFERYNIYGHAALETEAYEKTRPAPRADSRQPAFPTLHLFAYQLSVKYAPLPSAEQYPDQVCQATVRLQTDNEIMLPPNKDSTIGLALLDDLPNPSPSHQGETDQEATIVIVSTAEFADTYWAVVLLVKRAGAHYERVGIGAVYQGWIRKGLERSWICLR